MTEFRLRVIEALAQYGLPPEILVLVVAMLPIFELRGAIPVGINYLHLPWASVYLFAIIGNMVPVPVLLLIFQWLVRLGERIPILRRILARTERRGKVIDRYKLIGLVIFVAIPLPVTGAWTGALAARIFNIPFPQAIVGILAGVLIAGVIVTSLSLLGVLGAIIAGVGLIILMVHSFLRKG